jgi:SAM-dependent methyltransferase
VSESGTAPEPKLYRELAPWFHLLTSPVDYEEEAELYGRLLVEKARGSVESVLELGSGGGNNASHLKRLFELTLVDRSREMLEISRRLNPECEHIEGDMTTVRLGRTFDGVFVHDALAYVLTEEGLEGVFQTAFAHCRPGGSAVFVPDYVRETFATDTRQGGHDSADSQRGLRYLEWIHPVTANGTTYAVDFAYLLREQDAIRAEHDRHVCGLFPRETWLRGLDAAGFAVDVVEPDYSDSTGQFIFAAQRRA